MSTAAATEIHELAVATDTRLADLHGRATKIQGHIARAATTIKQYAGAERTDRGLYKMTLDQAEVIIATEGWKPRNAVAWWGRPGGDIDQARTTITASQNELDEVRALITGCDAVWETAGRWSRFFLVRGGHIHSSMACSTCNNGHEPTEFGWLPELSGLTEAEAVKAHGAILCTVCFPSAPVEWTNGRELEEAAKKAARCAGSGQYVKTESWQDRYAKCPECGTTQSRTSTGRLRAHKPPAEKKAKAKKATPAPVVPQVDEAWDAMQSDELDDALRVFTALEAVCGGATEGQTFEATRIAYRAMQRLAPEGWSSFRRAKDLGLNRAR